MVYSRRRRPNFKNRGTKLTRQEFKELVQKAQKVTDLLLKVSQDPSMISVKNQLDAVLPAIDKKPSRELADSLTMGQIISHSYSPAPTADIDRWATLILKVNHTYKKWTDANE